MQAASEGRAPRWWAVASLVVLTTLSAPAASAAGAESETGRYYVVGSRFNGQRDYLYGIALRTLGSGNRFREIIALNRGRKEPDGATFTDGVDLAPGWIIVLPADASGPEVRVGALPRIGPPSSPPKTTTSSSRSTTRKSPPGIVTPKPSPSATASTSMAGPTRAAPEPDRFDLSGLGRYREYLIRGGSGALAVVLAVLAVVVLRRGAHRMRPVTLDEGPWPPERHHTPTPAERAGPAAAPAEAQVTQPGAASGSAPSATPAPPPTGPATVGPELTPNSSGAPTSVVSGPPAVVQAVARARPPAGARVVVRAKPRVATRAVVLAGRSVVARAGPPADAQVEPPMREPAGAVRAAEPAGPAVLPRPALPSGADLPYVEAELVSEVGPIDVRLIGVNSGPQTPAYAWLTEDEPTPAATVPLVLGRQGPWWLHLDLGRTPDVVTVVGALADCRRLVAAFARQLHSDGVGVAVVGDALGDSAFDGCRRLAAFPAPGDEPPGPNVILVAGAPSDGMDTARSIVAATGGRCVPVLIGAIPHGRWSIQVGAAP